LLKNFANINCGNIGNIRSGDNDSQRRFFMVNIFAPPPSPMLCTSADCADVHSIGEGGGAVCPSVRVSVTLETNKHIFCLYYIILSYYYSVFTFGKNKISDLT